MTAWSLRSTRAVATRFLSLLLLWLVVAAVGAFARSSDAPKKRFVLHSSNRNSKLVIPGSNPILLQGRGGRTQRLKPPSPLTVLTSHHPIKEPHNHNDEEDDEDKLAVPPSWMAGEEDDSNTEPQPVVSAKEEQPSPAKEEAETPEELQEDPKVRFLTRLLFLSYYASMGSLFPYLSVYYHSWGHGGQIIGLLAAIKPFTGFVVAPAWGLLADQAKHPQRILQVTFLASTLGHLLIGSGCKQATYLSAVIFMTAIFNSPVKSLMDTMVLRQLVDPKTYGRLRIWAQMGYAIGSSVAGYLVAKTKNAAASAASSPDSLAGNTVLRGLQQLWKVLTGHRGLFLLYGLLSLPSWFCIQAFNRMEQEQKRVAAATGTTTLAARNTGKPKQKKHVLRGLRLVSRNTDALIFFFLVLAVGVSNGVIENFAYVRMREVGVTGKVLGMCRGLSSLAGIPMFWYSGLLTKALGVDKVVILTLLSYSLRFLIYATMTSALYGLPAEILRGVTFAAFWSSATLYAHRVAPDGLQATMLLLTNAMSGGLGQSVGALLGGRLQHMFGTSRAFLLGAGADAGLAAGLFVYLRLRKTSSNFVDPQPISED